MNNLNEFIGGRIINTRLLTPEVISQLLDIGAVIKPAVIKQNDKTICRRCRSEITLELFSEKTAYCRQCVNFGKLNLDDELLITPSTIDFFKQPYPMSWQGKLTPLQEKVSQEVVQSYQQKKDHLIWAVTGAGKTEIIFPLLENAIREGKRVAICSPRIDVCLELYPRIKQAFENTSIGLFHGKSEERYSACQIMIATVHQLIRFEKAFDLLIVDEVDSFPLAGDVMLERAIYKSQKDQSNIVFLSATPPLSLLKKVEHGEVRQSLLYRRFHGHPLPQPQCHLLLKKVDFCRINPRLRHRIKCLIKQQQRFILFFPRIPNMLKFEAEVKKIFPELKTVSVSAKDAQRIEKVAKFRRGELDAILTTTILERGVTFKKIAVIVVDADAEQFSKTSLIQIAGRAGRDKNFPDDEVHFYYQYFSVQVQQACAEIRKLNRHRELI